MSRARSPAQIYLLALALVQLLPHITKARATTSQLLQQAIIAAIGRRTRLRNSDVLEMLEVLVEVWSEELASGGRIEAAWRVGALPEGVQGFLDHLLAVKACRVEEGYLAGQDQVQERLLCAVQPLVGFPDLAHRLADRLSHRPYMTRFHHLRQVADSMDRRMQHMGHAVQQFRQVQRQDVALEDRLTLLFLHALCSFWQLLS